MGSRVLTLLYFVAIAYSSVPRAEAQELTVAVTIADAEIHREATPSSPIFATVPKEMQLIVKGRMPGWIKISGPNQRDAWVEERLVRIENRTLTRKDGAASEPTAAESPSVQTRETWSIERPNDTSEALRTKVEALERRVDRLEKLQPPR